LWHKALRKRKIGLAANLPAKFGFNEAPEVEMSQKANVKESLSYGDLKKEAVLSGRPVTRTDRVWHKCCAR
jgi:hypothetical protein